jgi:hypothetical protein
MVLAKSMQVRKFVPACIVVGNDNSGAPGPWIKVRLQKRCGINYMAETRACANFHFWLNL